MMTEDKYVKTCLSTAREDYGESVFPNPCRSKYSWCSRACARMVESTDRRHIVMPIWNEHLGTREQ